jgi:hypothetical protein
MTSQRQREEFDELPAAAKEVPAFVGIGDQRGQLLREELFSAGGAQNSSFLKKRAEVFGRDFERDALLFNSAHSVDDGSASIWYMCCSAGVSAGSFLIFKDNDGFWFVCGLGFVADGDAFVFSAAAHAMTARWPTVWDLPGRPTRQRPSPTM